MDTQGAVRVAFGMVFLGELVLCKGFWIVLLRVCHDGRGIQANEGGIHDPHLIEFLHLCRHDFFQCSVIHFFEETVIRPVGRQRLHDIEPAVVGNEPVVVQIIRQICDLREPLAFHNDKSTDHGFLRKAPPPGCRSGQREVQAAEKLVVERSGALGCEQRHILNDFLSVDSGQPLSGWFSLQADFTKKGLRFLYHLSDFRFQP